MQEKLNPTDSYKPRPGDKVFRIPRTKTWHVVLPKIHRKRVIGISLWSLVYGFAGIIFAGMVILMLPISSNSGQWTSWITSLFTAASSVCVTGLVVVDTADHWSLFGQIAILLMVQIGGLGFMASTTLIMLAAGRKIGFRDRLVISESAGAGAPGSIVRITRNMIIFTLVVELIGAAVFLIHFAPQYGWADGIWRSVFQSVAGFNNAGFDLFGGFRSLTGLFNDYLILITTAILIILGSLSFIVILDIFRSRGLKRSSVDTKLVVLISGILLVAGTIIVLLTEFNNPLTLGPMSLPEKIMNAFFQSVSTRSSGFSTVNIGSMTIFTLFTFMVLMFIGGASNSTAGGIKVNTLGLIAITVWNTIRGRENPGAFGREFQIQQLFRAITLLVLAIALIVVVFLILSTTEHFSSLNILFEVVSAFGIVGLSTGITPELTIFGQSVIIILMFIGRLGPLTLTMILANTHRTSTYRYPKESIRIG
jgi:trk system potassium uptake protein TrkH